MYYCARMILPTTHFVFMHGYEWVLLQLFLCYLVSLRSFIFINGVMVWPACPLLFYANRFAMHFSLLQSLVWPPQRFPMNHDGTVQLCVCDVLRHAHDWSALSPSMWLSLAVSACINKSYCVACDEGSRTRCYRQPESVVRLEAREHYRTH